jgi:hypothetical protein
VLDIRIILGHTHQEILIFNMDSLSEKRKTIQSKNSEIVEARVIANYGDPGLDEDYHFDILSRYVVVMIESCQRVLTKDKCLNMIALVKRPESLWISAASTPDNNPTNQKRTDAKNNTSMGLAGSFSSNGISRIYPSYAFGESIRIRRLSQPIQPQDSFFLSAFSAWNEVSWGYAGWHSEGSTLPYFTTDAMKASLRAKTIVPIASNSNYYMGILNKMQYEAFSLYLNQGNSTLSNAMASIFNGTWGGNPAVYSANGGYVFSSSQSILLNAASFEDMNIGNKARVASNECIPLVVTTPDTFPMPSSRSIGTIVYNPTYSPITK